MLLESVRRMTARAVPSVSDGGMDIMLVKAVIGPRRQIYHHGLLWRINGTKQSRVSGYAIISCRI